MTPIEQANAMLLAAAATALLNHARALVAGGASADTVSNSLAVYAGDLEKWRAEAYARIRDEAPVGLEVGLLKLGCTLSAGMAWSDPDRSPAEITGVVGRVLQQVRAALDAEADA